MNEPRERKPWFRPKTYGVGWTPDAWQGWLVTLGFVALFIATVALLAPPGPRSLAAVPFVQRARELLGLSRFSISPLTRYIVGAVEVCAFLLVAWATSRRPPPLD